MPELPEVETVMRGIAPEITSKVIEGVTHNRADLRIPFPKHFVQTLEGATIQSIQRRAKYLLIDIGRDQHWVIHLGMSGKVLLRDALPNDLNKHAHVITRFADGSVMIYEDPRRFGLMTLVPRNWQQHELFFHLGPEPLSDDFNAEYLHAKLRSKNTPIKHAIMDQTTVVGVGNIYACESLFRSRINPKTHACKISKTRCGYLVDNIKEVLSEAITSGGSTLRDYVRSDGSLGYFQHQFAVYGRENEPCAACSTPIRRSVQQNRSTFYCPSCQSR